MQKITLVYPYFDNAEMLKKHLATWCNYQDKDFFEVIIVDDCSPNKPAKDYLYDVGFPIRLFRITTQIPWNQHGAKNLAMKHASGWCLLADMDLLLTAEEAKVLIHANLDDTCYYRSLRRYNNHSSIDYHANSFVITTTMYWAIGGYDEAYAGYYGTDRAFKRRLKKFFPNEKPSPMLLTPYNHIIEDARTQAFGRENSPYHLSRNLRLRLRMRIGPKPIKPLNFDWEMISIAKQHHIK